MKHLLALIFITVTLAAAHAQPRYLMQGHSLQGDPERHARTINLLNEAGIEMLRDECHWQNVEKTKGTYALPPNVLRNIDYAREHNVEILLILNYANPLYDEGMAPHTPEGRAAFAKYCEFMASELKDRVTYFEIWNEPNIDGFWSPKANASDYTALLHEAYKAVKKGNPEATVLGGAFSGVPFDFLDTMIAEGALDSMDALSIHPYSSPNTPEAADIFGKMKTMREMTERGGKPLPIWVTEYGFPTSEGAVTEAFQANMIARSYILAQTHDWLPVFGWYWFGPDGPDASWTEDRFGIIRNDWSPKPSFHALKLAISTLKGAIYINSHQPGALHAHTFALPESNSTGYQYATALWSPIGTRQLKVSISDNARVHTLRGNPVTLQPFGGIIVLDVYDEPIYLFTKDLPEIEFFTPELAAFPKRPTNLTMSTTQPLLHSGQIPEGMTVGWIHEPTAPFSFWKDENNQLFARPIANAPRGEHYLPAALFSINSKPFGRIIARVNVVDPVQIKFNPVIGAHSPRFEVLVTRANEDVRLEGTVTLTAANNVVIQPTTFNLDPAQSEFRQTVAVVSNEAPDTIYWIDARAELANGDTAAISDHFSFMTSPRATAPITIDGKLNDWPKHDPINLNRRAQLSGELRKWDGPEDASARIWTAWDSEWFYLAAEVIDDEQSSPSKGFSVYNNDGIELYFDTDHEGDRAERTYSDDDNQYGFFMEQERDVVYAWSHLNNYSPGAKIKINRKPAEKDGITGRPVSYIIEAAVPVKEINLEPRPGMLIGFGAALTDDDDPRTVHPFGQEVQLSWTGLRMAWQNPTRLADLILVE